ncbi:MAG TPA: hypothetical protein PLL50_07225 [Propionicimonas sp.]|nr:hypothetical protein [Propionicimonas sp.]
MRSMTGVERAVLDRMLSVEFVGVDVLRSQAEQIVSVAPGCVCGCPTIELVVNRDGVPTATGWSRIPAELQEMERSDGIPRSVLCFVDREGYLSNLECVYYDEPQGEWPLLQGCAVLLRDGDGYVTAVVLPGGARVDARAPLGAWVSFEAADGGFIATTFDGYREEYAADGALRASVFVK